MRPNKKWISNKRNKNPKGPCQESGDLGGTIQAAAPLEGPFSSYRRCKTIQLSLEMTLLHAWSFFFSGCTYPDILNILIFFTETQASSKGFMEKLLRGSWHDFISLLQPWCKYTWSMSILPLKSPWSLTILPRMFLNSAPCECCFQVMLELKMDNSFLPHVWWTLNKEKHGFTGDFLWWVSLRRKKNSEAILSSPFKCVKFDNF